MSSVYEDCLRVLELKFNSFENFDSSTHPFEKPPLFRRKQYAYVLNEKEPQNIFSAKILEDNLNQVTCILHLVQKKADAHLILDAHLCINSAEEMGAQINHYLTWFYKTP